MTDPNPSKPNEIQLRNALGNISDKSPISLDETFPLVDKYARMRSQWKYLGDIHQGLSSCHKFVIGKNPHNTSDGHAHYHVHRSGRQVLSNMNRCNSVDCSVCGGHERLKIAQKLEMAMAMNTMRGGEALFITGTQRAQKDSQCITAVQKAHQLIRKNLTDFNSKHKTQFSFFMAIEVGFSHNKSDRPDVYRHHYHAHSHWVCLICKEDLHMKDRMKKLVQKWWIKGIEENGGIVRYQSGKRKGQLIYKDMMRFDDANPSVAIAGYITKAILPMELTHGTTKDMTKNRSLETLKGDLARSPNKADIELLREYHRRMFKKRRFHKSERIDELAQEWKDWINRRDGNHAMELGLVDWCELRDIDPNTLDAHTLKLLLSPRNLPDPNEVVTAKNHWLDEWLHDPVLNPSRHHLPQIFRLDLLNRLRSLRRHQFEYIKLNPLGRYLDSKSTAPKEDPVIFEIKIPKPLYDYLQRKGYIWPILSRVRLHVTGAFESPNIVATFKQLCSDPLIGSLNADNTKRSWYEEVDTSLERAIKDDALHHQLLAASENSSENG